MPNRNDGGSGGQSNQQEPVDWFQRHVLSGLNDLKEGQRSLEITISEHARVASESLADHAASDNREFSYVKGQLASLKPVRMIVYGAAAMIMATVFGAVIALVVHQATGR